MPTLSWNCLLPFFGAEHFQTYIYGRFGQLSLTTRVHHPKNLADSHIYTVKYKIINPLLEMVLPEMKPL